MMHASSEDEDPGENTTFHQKHTMGQPSYHRTRSHDVGVRISSEQMDSHDSQQITTSLHTFLQDHTDQEIPVLIQLVQTI